MRHRIPGKRSFMNTDAKTIGLGAERQLRDCALRAPNAAPSEDTLWRCVAAFRGCEFKTMSGLPFSYRLKIGRNGAFTKELWINRRENSKSLAWSSVLLAYGNITAIGAIIDRPKALGDIRGISYIYGMFYRFGLIDAPEAATEKMNVV